MGTLRSECGSRSIASPRNAGTASELVEELRESGPLLVTGELDDDQAGLIDRLDGVLPFPLRTRHPGAFAELPGDAGGPARRGQHDRAGLPLPLIRSRMPNLPGTVARCYRPR